jgi:hypothetical protein
MCPNPDLPDQFDLPLNFHSPEIHAGLIRLAAGKEQQLIARTVVMPIKDARQRARLVP